VRIKRVSNHKINKARICLAFQTTHSEGINTFLVSKNPGYLRLFKVHNPPSIQSSFMQDGCTETGKVGVQNNCVFLVRYARKISSNYTIFSRNSAGCKTHGKNPYDSVLGKNKLRYYIGKYLYF
jgi:hypothetical protein